MLKAQTAQMYCLADRLYYETPERIVDDATRFQLPTGHRQGWRERQIGLWINVIPDHPPLPEQGWKIHVSSIPETAEATLATTSAICFSRGVQFKYLRSRDALQLSVGKYMPRSSSGKFIAIYPVGADQFTALLGDLVAALDGQPGPYILTDLRISRGPVYVRFGAFTEQWCPGPDGSPVRALRGPSGDLVPDERRPVFTVPAWAPVPGTLLPHLAARDAAGDGSFPYLVRKALYFTNSGGTYLAEHRDSGAQVVLREARPHSGFDASGSTAVDRLYREYRLLRRLAGLACVPRVYGVHTVWEHHFLAEEYIEGERLLNAVIVRYPLVHREPAPEAIGEYVRWATAIIERLSAALDAMHARGLSFGDLHPANVMVRPDGSVVLIDFEYAAELDDCATPRAGAPGYRAGTGTSRADADRYALHAIWLMMLMPLAELTERDSGKAATLECLARDRFRLPASAASPPAGAAMPADLAGSEPTGEQVVAALFDPARLDWPAIRDQIAAGIVGAATPDRTDRLFPADPQVFATGGFTLAHGAAGVLLALQRAGAEVPPAYADWLAASALLAGKVHWRGLFDGLYGAAVVLHELGRKDDALELLARARASHPPQTAGLFGGMAGAALAQCYFADLTGDGDLLAEAVRTADRLDALLRTGEAGDLRLPSSGGLMHGMSGAAALQLRLYRVTGDSRHLRAARRALHRDIGFCVSMPDGTCQLREGPRHLLYLEGGSGGVALVAQEYLNVVEDSSLREFVAAVRLGCEPEFVREPGLFHGRAGLMAVLALLSAPCGQEQVRTQVSRLSWHAVHRGQGLYFPGAKLLRFSADLATGSAGVLLALHIALHPAGGVFQLLPFGQRHADPVSVR